MNQKLLIADLRHQHQAYVWWHQKIANKSTALLLAFAINDACDIVAYSVKEPHIAMIKLQWWYDKIEAGNNITGHPLLAHNDILTDEYRHAICTRTEKIGDLLEHSNKDKSWAEWQNDLYEKEHYFWKIIYPDSNEKIKQIALFLFLYELPLICKHQQFSFLHHDICNPYQHEKWRDSVKSMVDSLAYPSDDAISSYMSLQKKHWHGLDYHIWQPTWRKLPILSLLKYQFMC